jgi:GDPmannose 4,6-dehydratase
MRRKVALIFGITGQDGSYLADLLLNKGYVVHGIKRRSSSFNTSRIEHIYEDPHVKVRNFFLHYGDITDSLSVLKNILLIKPDEIYNLAAQSHVAVSFKVPEYTANVDGIGALRILDAIKSLKMEKKVKYYQAGTSEMFGLSRPPQNEKTAFYPRSPYAVAKLYAYWITINYRESYNIFACNGILFNHESPRRGETFVTRKITRFLTRWLCELEKTLYLGNIYAVRDWGHAEDYVEMQWRILQQKKPDDYVVATGAICSVKEFVNKCCKYLDVKINWVGKGLNEYAYTIKNKKKVIFIKIDKSYFRPLEVDFLRGDSRKAFNKLKFKPKHNLNSLIKEMIDSDLSLAKKEITLNFNKLIKI